ncbi:MAG: site-specific DNA-methyltransferase, partial [Clostridia bacterium]|nr:site-specific DNA-methyltransferase [Clostridia bacterium]
LPGEYIKAMSDVGDIVIEPFCGSGTTLIACEQLDRCCYGMELEPKYVDVIIDRWEQFTGEKAVLLNA